MNNLALNTEPSALEVYQTSGGLDPVIAAVRRFVDEFEHDVSTDAGRKRTASLATPFTAYRSAATNTNQEASHV